MCYFCYLIYLAYILLSNICLILRENMWRIYVYDVKNMFICFYNFA